MNKYESNLDRRLNGVNKLYGFRSFQNLSKLHVTIVELDRVNSWTAEALI